VGYHMGMRMHISLDDDLVKQIDELTGPRGRSALIREAVEMEVDRRRRRAALERLVGSMPDFAPWMTPEWISQERERETEAYDRKIEEQWRKPLE
jgi:Ribbon-helix-helix protein, copG family